MRMRLSELRSLLREASASDIDVLWKRAIDDDTDGSMDSEEARLVLLDALEENGTDEKVIDAVRRKPEYPNDGNMTMWRDRCNFVRFGKEIVRPISIDYFRTNFVDVSNIFNTWWEWMDTEEPGDGIQSVCLIDGTYISITYRLDGTLLNWARNVPSVWGEPEYSRIESRTHAATANDQADPELDPTEFDS